MKFLLTYIWGLELHLEIIKFSAGKRFRNCPTESSHLTFEINWSLLKRSPGMGSCGENSESLRPLQENKIRVLWSQFFSKQRLALEMCFCAPPGCSRQECVHCRLLSIARCWYSIIYLNYPLYPSVQKHGFAHAMCYLSLWLYTA